jgi:transketolase
LRLKRTDGPTVLCLTRQNLPQLRTKANDNPCANGAYELLPAEGGKAQVTIFASGSEVEIAVNAAQATGREGRPRPRCLGAVDGIVPGAQDEAYRKSIIGTAPVRIAVEAGLRFGWDAIIGEHGLFVGMTGFGASAPAKDLYKHFGITAEAVTEKVMSRHNG